MASYAVINLRFVRLTDRWIGIPLCYLLARLLRLTRGRAGRGAPQRILVIRTWGLGNLTLMLPALKTLRERFPDARLDAITLNQNRGFLERTGYFTRVTYLSNRSFLQFLRTFLAAFLPLWRARYDTLVDFEQFARVSALIGLLLGIPRRIGFDTPGQGRAAAYTDPVPYHNDRHMADCFYTLLEPLGIAPRLDLPPVPIPVSDDETAAVARLLAGAGIDGRTPVAVVHPGSGPNFVLRRWPEENFAALADFLADRFGLRIVLTGVPAEQDIVTRVRQAMKYPAVDTVGHLRLGELLALMNRAAVVVASDTGPAHLACAQGTPVIAFYGPNTPRLYGPRGPHDVVFYLALPCSPCITNYNEKVSTCTDPICLKWITLDDVTRRLTRAFPAGLPVPAAATRQAIDAAS